MTDKIKERILHMLGIYPIISPTMVQVGLGPQVKPADWRPVYNKMLEDGEIVMTPLNRETPYGKSNTYTLIHLPGALDEG